MSSQDVLVRENDVDVAGLFAALKRKWWLVLLVTVLGGFGLFVVLSLISPRYLSTADVLIASQATTAVEQIQEGGNRQIDNRIDERTVSTEVEVLSSDKIALQVIKQLNLAGLEEFQDDGANWQDQIIENVSKVTGDLTPKPDLASGSEAITPDDIAQSTALRKFREKIKVFAVEKSQVIRIEFWSYDPVLARNVVSAITERYRSSKVDESRQNVEQAAGFVNPRIAELRALIDKERQAVAKFESDNQIFKTNNGSNNGPGLLVNQELSEASTELSRLRAERSAAQAKIASIRAALASGSSLDTIPEVLASQYIQNLRQSEVAIQAQISDLSTSLLPQHPRMKALNSQVQRYRSQIRQATQDIVKSLESNVASLRNAEKKLAEEIDQLKNDQLKVNSLLVKLDGHQKNISAFEEELQQRLADSQRVRSRAEIPPAAANVISPASIPDEPYFPKVVPFTLAGMAAIAVLMVVAILAVNLVTTVSSYHTAEATPRREDEEIEPEVAQKPKKKSGFEELSNMMFGKLRPDDDAQGKPEAGIAPQAGANPEENTIAVRYAASVLGDMGQGRIAVVSPGGERGSRTACILARMLSDSRRKVVLIDLSGSAATTVEMLGSAEVPGIFNLVTGGVMAEEAIFKDRASRVNIVPAGHLFDAANMPDMTVVGEAIDAIAASYDFCVVDCGDANLEGIDIVSTDDAVIVISAVDADLSDCDLLERDLKREGFNDILQIIPDQKDMESEARVAA